MNTSNRFLLQHQIPATRLSISRILLLSLFILTSCRVQWIADRDETIVNQILATARKVDAFYMELETDETHLVTFENALAGYREIELDLRSLWLQAEAKPLNRESARIARITLDLWIKYKEDHKNRGTYNIHLINRHRTRFHELFVAMLNLEKAKEMKEE